ncbi:MAG: GTPase HflX [Christensenellaceae bacterium]
MLKNTNYYEKAIILEADLGEDDIERKISEIESLVLVTDAELFTTVVQKIRTINPATYFGSGKLNEIKRLIADNGVNLVIFDGEMSPSQLNNVSDVLDVKVINRTTLILDIFARRAVSNEGKVLVELAQLKYIYPRLSGQKENLSRLGGGIGTRGPGETKLETNRRYIKSRIHSLENQLKLIEKRRNMQQARRNKNGVKTVALVGYTNTGKSTLLNKLTASKVLAKDQLFATLDTTLRKADIEGFNLVFTDTVGFVKDLPPTLLEAFKATLECVKDADLILNVCDLSDDYNSQVEITNNVITEINRNSGIIVVGNKFDKISDCDLIPHDYSLISAVTGFGLDKLKKRIVKHLFSEDKKYTFKLKYNQYGLIESVKKLADKTEVKTTDGGVVIDVYCDLERAEKIKKLLS